MRTGQEISENNYSNLSQRLKEIESQPKLRVSQIILGKWFLTNVCFSRDNTNSCQSN